MMIGGEPAVSDRSMNRLSWRNKEPVDVQELLPPIDRWLTGIWGICLGLIKGKPDGCRQHVTRGTCKH